MAEPKRRTRSTSSKPAPKRGRETTTETTPTTGTAITKAITKVITKIVPAHGHGALNSGGTPGNKGGPGRPPSAIRQQWRELLSTSGTKHIEEVLNGTVPLAAQCEKCGHRPKRNLKLESTIANRTDVVGLLARFGIGVRDELNVISPEVRMRVQQTVAVISSRSKWDTEELLTALDGIW